MAKKGINQKPLNMKLGSSLIRNLGELKYSLSIVLLVLQIESIQANGINTNVRWKNKGSKT